MVVDAPHPVSLPRCVEEGSFEGIASSNGLEKEIT
jgi:hypothetical protein